MGLCPSYSLSHYAPKGMCTKLMTSGIPERKLNRIDGYRWHVRMVAFTMSIPLDLLERKYSCQNGRTYQPINLPKPTITYPTKENSTK